MATGQQWAQGLQGMGAWFSGQGPQYEAAQALQARTAQEDARQRKLDELAMNKERVAAMTQDFSQTLSLINSGRPDLALQLLDNRIPLIEQMGGDTYHTKTLRQKIAEGSPDVIPELTSFLTAAGVEIPTGGDKYLKTQNGQAMFLRQDGTAYAKPVEGYQAPPDATAAAPYSKPVEVMGPDGKIILASWDARSGQYIPVSGGFSPAPTAPPAVGFADESKLRKEYMATAKPFIDQNASFGRLQVSANNPTPAGDMALIFNYMKILDPASAVREAEYATAANAGAVPDKVWNLYNKTLSGEGLTPKQRADFYARGKSLFTEANRQHEKIKEEYSRIAVDNGFKPENVLINVQTADPDAPVNTGGAPTKTIGGKTYVQMNGQWFEQ